LIIEQNKPQLKKMSYTFLTDENNAHVGGNILEGDPMTFCPQSWKYLVERFSIKSCLDMGSGYGYAADFFHSLGVKTVAVDGLKENCKNAVFPTVYHDFTQGSFLCKVDLIHCQEMVEHVEEDFLDNLLKTFQNAKIVAMTHAFPGQPGYHHVNSQPQSYWIEKMTKAGFKLLDVDTKRVREYAEKDGAIHLQRSGLVFHKI